MIAAEFEESGSRYLQSLRSKEEVRMSLLQAEMQLVQHEENMLDIRKQAYDEEQSRRTDLKNAIGQLAAQLSAWEHSKQCCKVPNVILFNTVKLYQYKCNQTQC